MTEWSDIERARQLRELSKLLQQQWECNVKAAAWQQTQAARESWESAELQWRETVQQELRALSKRIDQVEDLILWLAGIEGNRTEKTK